MEEDRIRFNWRELFLKVLFLLAFFLILLLLYPNNNLTTFYDKVFNENVQTMKEAAKSYYTLDKLPAENGSSKKMTLEAMLDNRIILPFVDKDGKKCDLDESYVEVTKLSSKEYSLKVSLSCSKQSDYIIDTIDYSSVCTDCNGSNSNNDSNNNNNDNNSNDNDDSNNNGNNTNDNEDNDNVGDKDSDSNSCTALEYEYKRSSTKLTYDLCPEGYYDGSSYCFKSVLESSLPARLSTTPSKKTVTDAKVNTGGVYKVYAEPEENAKYICGPEFDNAGTYNNPTDCIKSKEESTPSTKKTTYTCTSQYTNAGTYITYTKCYGSTSASDDSVANTVYVCGPEYDNAGTYNIPTTCKKTTIQKAEAVSKTTYTCGPEYDNAGTFDTNTICYKVTRHNEPAKLSATTTTYTCGSEYDNAGTYTSPVTCRKSSQATQSTTPGYYTGWSCGSCSVQKFTTSKSDTSTTKYEYKGGGYEYYCPSSSNCPGMVMVYKYVVYTRSYVNPVTTYTCSSSFDNAGTYSSPTTCLRTGNPTTSTTNSYTCDSSFINAGTYSTQVNCYKDIRTQGNSTPKTTYTCSSYYDNAGTYNVPTTCTKVIVASTISPAKTSYVCSSKYLNAGTYTVPTKCIYKADIADEPKTNTKYVCDNTFDNAGTYDTQVTCVRKGKVSVPSTTNTTYTCPTGYTNTTNNNQVTCYKEVKNNDTYYCSDANAKLVGTKCEIEKPGTKKYVCDKGILSNGKCYVYKNTVIDKKVDDCKETTEYIWSPTETLPGWERTGNTRNTSVRCPLVIDCTSNTDDDTCEAK